MLFFNILMYALMIYLIFRMFSMNKGVNKRRRVITVINQIQDKEAFYAAADDLIATADDPEIETKTKVIKLWGMVYHNDYNGFEQLLNEIDLTPAFAQKNGRLNIEQNEDTFFYFLLAIPNMLYGNDRNDLRKLVEEKIHLYDEKLSDQLIKAVSDHCTLYYDRTEDLGEEFFRNVSAGEYPGYRYSKQLIGIYKNVCDTMTCKILQERGEDFSDYEGYAQSFANSGVGRRWIKAIGLDIVLPSDDEEETENSYDEPAEQTEEPEVIEETETAEDSLPETESSENKEENE